VSEHRTRGLVLRTFDQGESDRLVHLYTEALGRVSVIAKGARRSRRRFPGLLELFNLLDARIVEPPRAQLARLEGASLARAFEGLSADLGRYAIACQLLELLDRLTGEREPNPQLFQFAVGVLGVLDGERPDPLLALLVLTKTLARLGYRPELVHCASCGVALEEAEGSPAFVPRHGGAVCEGCSEPHEPPVPGSLLRALEAGLRRPLRERAELGLGAGALRTARTLMDRFFQFHVGLELRTAPFLRAVLEGETALDAPPGPGDIRPASGGRAPTGARSASRPQ
jgi:DNA repair protein RecO (recombination protein O)